MPRKAPSISGFTTLSDQVFVREGGQAPASSPNDPDTVIIYGWGDGLPQHVAKYSVGYGQLFPRAKQIIVLSPIAKAMFTDLKARSDCMNHVLKSAFNIKGDAIAIDGTNGTVLVHAMSNAGAINYTSTLNSYLQAYNKPLPHQLFVMDSTPGSTNYSWANMKRWSRAMTLGTASWFPWPFVVTQGIWGIFLLFNGIYSWLVGRKHAGAWGRAAANNETYESKQARKLYLYSKEDDLIGYEDIEAHVAETREKGWVAETKVFSGSGHVGHMRQYPDLYWAAIREAWQRASQKA